MTREELQRAYNDGNVQGECILIAIQNGDKDSYNRFFAEAMVIGEALERINADLSKIYMLGYRIGKGEYGEEPLKGARKEIDIILKRATA